ncbi:CMP-N-acetylneuraminate-beta-galactosamide-alpha-2,3-sialyltransferase 1-like [Sebastes umbrosus]|uniref:CMP-N-acetylneuraminate-beta-galactosamide- alpha-2,3-sialyltransferase 1-like n=1 Tax=Sebastes umbrosus TaxID=72105 RepID=UPI00189DE66B|nr:CMP-N-acetylneuraminate-beta-galactosamide-alpha-2,3-sialyltransferase 1-like [Sebastes umbrosus]XP_037651474.1 CMP-N-acetylneuraminate-beta-galactosamide-alpha-2,3-sialyltransferase 1-like [Sebastes umbrosus]
MHHTAKMVKKGMVLIVVLGVTSISVFWRINMTPPCACDRCLSEDDPWFMQRFNKSVEPFLSANYKLSEDAFNWWKRLQAERRSFSTYRRTVDRLFQMFPPSPVVIEPRPDRCRTCAVVGNSGNLRGSHYGPLIDFHEFVIRINRGRIQGYEADVGSRITHRVMYPESAVHLDNTTYLVMAPFKTRDFEWIMKAITIGPSGKPRIRANKNLAMFMNPAFMRYVHDMWLQKKAGYPSTGFLALVLALHICDEVHVFGFGADSDGNWSHYWEKLRYKNLKTGGHPEGLEYKVIQELDMRRKLTFYAGW